jgi:beta-glucosidase
LAGAWGTYAPRLGLVDVDRKTFQRTPKPSARIYKQIIANNGFSGEKLVNQGNINPFINK